MAAATEEDADALVARYAVQYSIDQWMQPGSMVQVQLAKLKEETRCPMCFGKIRSARISMVCLHRYCAKCIEQYLRAKVPGRHGDDKECPVCRAHLHSRRATKPDHAFDKIIKALYGDVEQYDAEEEALIAQDNKAHVAAWQVQLADMKARQAAAVAAARTGSGTLTPGQHHSDWERRAGGGLSGLVGAPHSSMKGAAAAAGGGWSAADTGDRGLRSGHSYHNTAAAAGAAGGAGGAAGGAGGAPNPNRPRSGGLGSRKRSWSDLQQQEPGQQQQQERGAGGKMARIVPGSGDVVVLGSEGLSEDDEWGRDRDRDGDSRPSSRLGGRVPAAAAAAGHGGSSRGPGRPGAAAVAGLGGSARGSLQQQQQLRGGCDDEGDVDAALLLSSFSNAARARAAGAGAAAAAPKRLVKQEGASRGSRQQGQQQQQQQRSSPGVTKAGAAAGGGGGQAAAAAAAVGKKKKLSAREMASRLLGMAARAAAAAGPPARCCLVHLQPAGRPAAAAAAGAGRGGRGVKQHQQQQHNQQQQTEGQQQYSAPDVDQPYLTCPWELTVGCLKQVLLQQLQQQGALEHGGQQLSDVQLLLVQPAAAACSAGAGGSASAAAAAVGSVLGDGLTVGQLYDQWWGVGPELQLQYRLVKH